jgi:histidinol-phosphate aminotransferase
MSIIEKLARQELVDMVPYQSARRLQSKDQSVDQANTTATIWLNANEASGPGIYHIESDSINRYPDFQPENLLTAYSQYTGLTTDRILATRGADEGIEVLIRTFCRAYQDSILICPPTYGMYAISAQSHGANIVSVPLDQNLQLDMKGLAAQVGQVKIVFLCSPGNPTGNLLSIESIKASLALFADSAIVVVDEAYIEFCQSSSVLNLLDQYPQLVILRTLSKAFALAGLRCGFTLANPATIKLLSKIIAPYPISAPVAEIASASLSKQGIEQVSIRIQETTILRQQLALWLEQQSWCTRVFNSDANFILCQIINQELKEFIFSYLKQQGILIRDQSKQYRLDNCLRISIGSERELSIVKDTITNAITAKSTQER